MFAKDFETGDLVWAKMKNYPPWPGKIIDAPEDSKVKKGHHLVFFLGTKDHAWVKDESIHHHSPHLIPTTLKKKSPALQSAIDEIIELSKDRPFKLESIDGALFECSPETESPKEKKLKGKKLPKYKISRKGLSSRKLGKRSLEHSKRRSNSNLETSNSDVIKRVKLDPSKKIGFLGLGAMGQALAKNLLGSGHHVTVWNRTAGKCLDLIKEGAASGENPAEVVKASDIIFCCVSDQNAVKSLVLGENGVLKGLEDSARAEGKEKICKGYVEMTSIDFETVTEIAEAIEIKGGRYLKASLIGSKVQAEEGSLVILASGNEELFSDCEKCFQAIGKVAYHLGSDVGKSSKFGLVISAFMGTTFAAMAEALVLAQRANVPQYDFLKVLELKGFACPGVMDRARNIIAQTVGPRDTALKHQQKDMDLTLLMSNEVPQPMPVTTAANELYKHAKLLGYGDSDISSVYYGAKF